MDKLGRLHSKLLREIFWKLISNCINGLFVIGRLSLPTGCFAAGCSIMESFLLLKEHVLLSLQVCTLTTSVVCPYTRFARFVTGGRPPPP